MRHAPTWRSARRPGRRRRSRSSSGCLDGQRRWNRRLWTWLARAPEAVAGRPVGRASPWECRAARSRQVRHEEAHRRGAGALPRVHSDLAALRLMARCSMPSRAKRVRSLCAPAGILPQSSSSHPHATICSGMGATPAVDTVLARTARLGPKLPPMTEVPPSRKTTLASSAAAGVEPSADGASPGDGWPSLN
eukprot:scaffold111575_cov60-Phaeocystis_antarctica.AAC.1